MFLQYLQFGLLFSGVMFVLKASGLAPGLLAWSWLGCFTPVAIAAAFSIAFGAADAALEVLSNKIKRRDQRRASKGYL